jgi:LacI family transcriptional regulator
VPVLPGNFRADSGYELARQILRRRRRPTALLCGNDLMAVGAYFALKEAGVRVPEDVSVVGYDDQEDLAGDLSPALTTVRIPYYEMGAMAATALATGRRPPPRRSFVPCPPVVRDSVAPVPDAAGE